MASWLKKFSINSLAMAAVLVVFVLLFGRYYMPDNLRAATESAKLTTTYNLLHLRAQMDVTLDESLKNSPTNTENAESVPVLVYHGISSRETDISPETFRDHMYALKREGWNTIRLEEFIDFMRGTKKVPHKSVVITFDDGVRSSVLHADPIFNALDYNAAMFIISKFSMAEGSPYYLSRKEVEKMLAEGRWEIQSHGNLAHILIPITKQGDLHHFLSNLMWLEEKNRLETVDEYRQRLNTDFIESKAEIEKLGIEVFGYAFPFGDFGQDSQNLPSAQQIVLEEVEKVYPLANFYQFWPSQGSSFNYPKPNTKSFSIRRNTVESTWSAEELIRRLNVSQDKKLPYRDNFETNKGWKRVWGDLVPEYNATTTNDGITISASEETTGGLTFLDGSYTWTSYLMNATVVPEKGASFSLVGRYVDAGNHVSCTYYPNNLKVQIHNDGFEQTLASSEQPTFQYGIPINVSIRIEGNKVDCGVGNQILLTTEVVDAGLSVNGGVGVKTWDPIIDNSSAHFSAISITSP